MKAGVVYKKNDIRYDDIEKPKINDNEVLVKVKYTGICGSDIPRVNGDACHFFPNVLGHEFSGIICEIGKNVENLKLGDRVAGIPLIPCMKCDDCIRGNYSLCKNYSFVGSRQFGSFSEYIALPKSNVIKFDESISFINGTFFEPATIALHGLRRLNYKGGKSVAILGGGTIGIFTMQWAKIFGASNVVVFDIDNEKLNIAKKLGADITINTLDTYYNRDIMNATNGKGFDYVYETAGNVMTIKMALEISKNKGKICFIGTPNNEISFTVDEWENINRKELTLTGSWMSYSLPFPGNEWNLTAHYFKTKELKFDSSLVFKIIPLSNIKEAFEMYKTAGAVKGKILIESEK